MFGIGIRIGIEECILGFVSWWNCWFADLLIWLGGVVMLRVRGRSQWWQPKSIVSNQVNDGSVVFCYGRLFNGTWRASRRFDMEAIACIACGFWICFHWFSTVNATNLFDTVCCTMQSQTWLSLGSNIIGLLKAYPIARLTVSFPQFVHPPSTRFSPLMQT